MRRAVEAVVQVLEPGATPGSLQETIEEAAREAAAAIEETEGLPVSVSAEVRGGFAGAGEAVVVVMFLLKAAAGGAAGFAGKKAAEALYEKYVAPRLRKRNVVTTEVHAREADGGSDDGDE